MKLRFAALSGLPFGSMAIAHDGAKGIVPERMKAISAMEKHMKAVAGLRQGKEPFNPADMPEETLPAGVWVATKFSAPAFAM